MSLFPSNPPTSRQRGSLLDRRLPDRGQPSRLPPQPYQEHHRLEGGQRQASRYLFLFLEHKKILFLEFN